MKKALLASLQDAKKNKLNKNKTAINDNVDDNSNCSKITSNTRSESVKETNNSDNNHSSLLSLAVKKAKNPAQRKFAQGSANNSPVTTPIKVGLAPSSIPHVIDIFPKQRPKTEDFLTFLCLRGTNVLPPSLDFYRFNNENGKLKSNGKTNSDSSEGEQNTVSTRDKNCGSSSAKHSDKRNHGSNVTNKLVNNKNIHNANKKSDILKEKTQVVQKKPKLDDKTKKIIDKKDAQHSSKQISLPNLKRSIKNNNESNKIERTKVSDNLRNKSINTLKEKYKEQRKAKKSVVNTQKLKHIKKAKEESNVKIGIQTRTSSKKQIIPVDNEKEKASVKNKKIKKDISSERILRSSHHQVANDEKTQDKPKSSNKLKKKSRLTSPVGIRPHKRKAKPAFSLGDFESAEDTDSDTEKVKKGRVDIQKLKKSAGDINPDTEKVKKSRMGIQKSKKNPGEIDSNTEKVRKSQVDIHKSKKNPELNKKNLHLKKKTKLIKDKQDKKSQNDSKTKLSKKSSKNLSVTKRITRSAKRNSPPKDKSALEREKFIKQKIVEIEKKHKQLRRFASDQSLHSSTSSTTSSESLPSSSESSSSSINIPRLTRSLEHLKRIRDIAAKLKKEQKKRKEKKMAKEKIEKTKKNVKKEGKIKLIDKLRIDKLKNTRNSKDKISSSNDKNKKIVKRKQILTRQSERYKKKINNSKIKLKSSKLNDEDESDILVTEDGSITSNLDEDMERASIVLQDMAEEINNTLDDITNEVAHSVPDLVYGNKDHIQGLMTTEFSGAFSEETITTASAMLLPSNSFYIHHTDAPSRNTADASTNTYEEDIANSFDESGQSKYESSVGTQTIEAPNESTRRYNLKNK